MADHFVNFRRATMRATYVSETTSTNDLAREARFSHGDIVIADTQTKGRGQRGNSWESEPGKNLTFSLIIEPQRLHAENQFMLSECVSLSIADTLRAFGVEASIKWPNDIYVGREKIAGILIENDIQGGNISKSIIGIGLNVNQSEFSEWIPNPVSMNIAARRQFDRETVLGQFCDSFATYYAKLCREEFEAMADDYFSRLYLAGALHRFTLPDGQQFDGKIIEVGSGGELIVETANNETQSFLFKEIIF